MTQISLTIPEKMLNESTQHAEGQGYRSVQEFILEALRQRLAQEKHGSSRSSRRGKVPG